MLAPCLTLPNPLSEGRRPSEDLLEEDLFNLSEEEGDRPPYSPGSSSSDRDTDSDDDDFLNPPQQQIGEL